MPEQKPPKHILIPKHEIMGKEAAEKLLQDYNTTKDKLPKIHKSDPALRGMGAEVGDIIKISREDVTGKNAYYRVVVK